MGTSIFPICIFLLLLSDKASASIVILIYDHQQT
jgi:hypothetical protein